MVIVMKLVISAVRIQKAFRRFRAKKRAVKIQRCYRRYRKRSAFWELIARKLQHAFRVGVVRSQLLFYLKRKRVRKSARGTVFARLATFNVFAGEIEMIQRAVRQWRRDRRRRAIQTVKQIRCELKRLEDRKEKRTALAGMYAKYLLNMSVLEDERRRIQQHTANVRSRFENEWKDYEQKLKKYCARKEDIEDFIQITNQFGTTIWINMKGNGYQETVKSPQDAYFEMNKANLYSKGIKELAALVDIDEKAIAEVSSALQTLRDELDRQLLSFGK